MEANSLPQLFFKQLRNTFSENKLEILAVVWAL